MTQTVFTDDDGGGSSNDEEKENVNKSLNHFKHFKTESTEVKITITCYLSKVVRNQQQTQKKKKLSALTSFSLAFFGDNVNPKK